MNGPVLVGGPSDTATTQELGLIQIGQFMVPIAGQAGARPEAADTKPVFPIKFKKAHPMVVHEVAKGVRVTDIETPPLIPFGMHAPVAFFEHGGKTYFHQTHDPALFQKVESKKS